MLFESPVFSKASGSQGGTTFSHNRYGMYTRSRSTPVNPSSQRQQSHRAGMQYLTETWREILTQHQRDGWDVYGDNVVMKNKIGQDVYLPGFNHFLRSNLAREISDSTIVILPPQIFTLPEADTGVYVAYSSASQHSSVNFNTSLPWANENGAHMSVFMSKPVNVHRNFVGGPYRFMGVLHGDASAAPTSPTVMPAPFPFGMNQRISTKFRISRADARLSEPFRYTSASGF